MTYADADLEAVVARALEDAAGRVEVAGRGQRLATRHHTYRDRARALVTEALAVEPARLRRVAPAQPLAEVG